MSPKWAIFLGTSAVALPGGAEDSMSVSTVPLRTGHRIRASPSADGRRVRASSWVDGPTWLRTGWSRAIFTLGASAVVGIAAGLGTKTAVAAVFGVAVVVIVLAPPGDRGLYAGCRRAAGLGAAGGIACTAVSAVRGADRQHRSSAAAAGAGRARPLAGERSTGSRSDTPLPTLVLARSILCPSGSPITLADADKLLGPIQFFILYRAVLTTLTTERQRRVALRILLFASVPVSLLAVLQEMHFPGIAALLANATASQIFVTTLGVSRATGPFAIWHDLGSYLLVIVMLGVALLVNRSRQLMKPRILVWDRGARRYRADLHGERDSDRGRSGWSVGVGADRPTAQTVGCARSRAHRAPRRHVRPDPGHAL